MKTFIAGAGLLAILNAISIEHHANEETLNIRHVSNQEDCDRFNLFNGDRYVFDPNFCACFFNEEEYAGSFAHCGPDRINNPLDLDKCIRQCQLDEALNHGLDGQCNIPRNGDGALHRHSRGWHKHRVTNSGCGGRVVHNYSRVEVAPEQTLPDYQQYIDLHNMHNRDLEFDFD